MVLLEIVWVILHLNSVFGPHFTDVRAISNAEKNVHV